VKAINKQPKLQHEEKGERKEADCIYGCLQFSQNCRQAKDDTKEVMRND
jgi:hypothetical protein